MDNLEHLISAYFYESWDQYEYSTWKDAVDDFVRRSPQRAITISDDIDQMVGEASSESELSKRLQDWGFDYSPPQGVLAWLLAVRDRIADRELKMRSPSPPSVTPRG